jgi:hypothetical protein
MLSFAFGFFLLSSLYDTTLKIIFISFLWIHLFQASKIWFRWNMMEMNYSYFLFICKEKEFPI